MGQASNDFCPPRRTTSHQKTENKKPLHHHFLPQAQQQKRDAPSSQKGTTVNDTNKKNSLWTALKLNKSVTDDLGYTKNQ